MIQEKFLSGLNGFQRDLMLECDKRSIGKIILKVAVYHNDFALRKRRSGVSLIGLESLSFTQNWNQKHEILFGTFSDETERQLSEELDYPKTNDINDDNTYCMYYENKNGVIKIVSETRPIAFHGCLFDSWKACGLSYNYECPLSPYGDLLCGIFMKDNKDLNKLIASVNARLELIKKSDFLDEIIRTIEAYIKFELPTVVDVQERIRNYFHNYAETKEIDDLLAGEISLEDKLFQLKKKRKELEIKSISLLEDIDD